jgi:hypothetical protein
MIKIARLPIKAKPPKEHSEKRVKRFEIAVSEAFARHCAVNYRFVLTTCVCGVQQLTTLG